MRKIIILLCLLLFVASCRHSNNKMQQHSQSPSSFNVPPIDTSGFLKVLQYTDDDSLYIHAKEDSNDYGNRFVEEIFRTDISNKPKDIRIIDVRYTLSIYPSNDQSDYGSYVVLYRDLNDTSDIKRFQEDSIEIFLDNSSMYSPQLIMNDINYDGYKDIIISYSSNTAGHESFNRFWTYNPEKKEFEEDSVLIDMFYNDAIYIDYDKKEVFTGGMSGVRGYGFEIYRWNGKTYELYAKDGTRENMAGTANIEMREELINGEWKIVKTDTSYYK